MCLLVCCIVRWHPMKYAQMLAEQMQKHGGTAWLINTGEMKGWGRNRCKLLSTSNTPLRTGAPALVCWHLPRHLSSACV